MIFGHFLQKKRQKKDSLLQKNAVFFFGYVV